ncbi:carbohydrate ABC transporter membrane protein 2, CUT1 family [Eubacterium uniforme]|uniref:Carbohydrate ABC transporter membrane protein 2, CUT1 family n=1 Tax=Eubacterium uniforme TaxID=39495 RepID=A0A1T4VPT4_9FIRM|nr:carbohydrate ABC transporter permease [Eubacterium uniforme]SKA67002.1 carbohydrate ABC transporter membrane protein 2, CUT1 family [Eubacterium uniforme]
MKKLSGNKIYRNCICIFLCFLSLFPFYLLFINSTLKSSDIQGTIRLIPGLNFFKNLKGLLEGEAKTSNVNVLQAMKNSLMVTVPATFLQVYFAALTAYGVHTYDFKFKKAAWGFIYAIMMVPTQISIVGFIKVAKMTNTYRTYIPLIIPAMAAPTTVYFMKQYMEASLSYEIIEAARIDGTTEFGTFNRIVIPLIKPAMATQAIFAFVGSWNNLFTPTMIIGNERKKMTMPMYVEALKANDKTQDMGQIYCGLFITVLPILVMYAFLSRYIVAGVALGGVKE